MRAPSREREREREQAITAARERHPDAREITASYYDRDLNVVVWLPNERVALHYGWDGPNLESEAEAQRVRREYRRNDEMARTATKSRSTKGKPKGSPKPAAKKGRSGLEAAKVVLAEADGPMKAGEIADKVISRKLAPSLKGATPKATIAAQIYTAAKRGNGIRKTDEGFVLAE